MTTSPPVTVVIPTRNRPQLLREAIESALGQDYMGDITVLVVYDGTEPDMTVERRNPGRCVRVVENVRSAGLAGARNSGLLASRDSLVAFCDDDDTWMTGKLRMQVNRLGQQPDAVLCSSGILVDFDDRISIRLAGSTAVQHEQLLRSRMAMLHSSTFVLRRECLTDGIGLVDERIPGGQNEDWDLLLRASARQPIAVVDRPLVRVRWGRSSHYARRWESKAAALEWMLAHHPDLADHRVGSARVYGQIAFAQASAGESREAVRWAVRAARRHPLEWRAGAAALVASKMVSGDRVLDVLHRFGRGV